MMSYNSCAIFASGTALYFQCKKSSNLIIIGFEWKQKCLLGVLLLLVTHFPAVFTARHSRSLPVCTSQILMKDTFLFS